MSEIQTRAHYDAGENKIIFHRIQDVEDIIERNKHLQSIDQKSDWGRHIASIPNVILEKWLNEEFARGRMLRLFSPEFNELVHRKLKDPDYAYLRTDKQWR